MKVKLQKTTSSVNRRIYGFSRGIHIVSQVQSATLANNDEFGITLYIIYIYNVLNLNGTWNRTRTDTTFQSTDFKSVLAT